MSINVYASMRITDGPPHSDNSSVQRCGLCDSEIWVYPPHFAGAVEAMGRDLVKVCNRCAQTLIAGQKAEGGDATVLPPIEAAA